MCECVHQAPAWFPAIQTWLSKIVGHSSKPSRHLHGAVRLRPQEADICGFPYFVRWSEVGSNKRMQEEDLIFSWKL